MPDDDIGYWLCFAKRGGGGMRWQEYTFAEAIEGKKGSPPDLGNISRHRFEIKWVPREAVSDAEGRCLIASKVDFIRPYDGKPINRYGAVVDLSSRKWENILVNGEMHYILTHDGKGIFAARDGSPFTEVL